MKCGPRKQDHKQVKERRQKEYGPILIWSNESTFI